MALTGDVTVIELDGPSLTALTASVSADAIAVKGWASSVRPEGVPAEDAARVGAWVGETLRNADVSRRRVVMAVSRGDVILKQLTLPGVLGTDAAGRGTGGRAALATEAEIAGIVRLQMARQASLTPAGSTVDYVRMDPRPSDEGGDKTAGGDAGGVGGVGVGRVMAAAMPTDRVAWAKQVAEAGGLTLRRIGVESYGVAALLAELSQRRDGPVLGVAIGPQSTEFVVIEDGEMAFARAVGLARPSGNANTPAASPTDLELEAFADRMAVEARRTWSSFRAQRPGEVACVAVLGRGEMARRVGERAAAALSVPFEMVNFPGYVSIPESMPDADCCGLAPLIGLLVEHVVGRPTLDFANPRRAPDVGAKARQGVLAAALGLVVLGGAGYVLADRQISGMRRQLLALRESEALLTKDRDSLLVDHARVNHFEQWAAGRVDWIGLTREVVDQLPEPARGQLDELAGRMDADPTYSGPGAYPGGKWGVRAAGGIQIAGHVGARQVAEDLRERLLRSGLYEVENRGPDVDDRFALLLRVSRLGPKDAAAAKPPVTGKVGGGGGGGGGGGEGGGGSGRT